MKKSTVKRLALILSIGALCPMHAKTPTQKAEIAVPTVALGLGGIGYAMNRDPRIGHFYIRSTLGGENPRYAYRRAFGITREEALERERLESERAQRIAEIRSQYRHNKKDSDLSKKSNKAEKKKDTDENSIEDTNNDIKNQNNEIKSTNGNVNNQTKNQEAPVNNSPEVEGGESKDGIIDVAE